MHNLWRGLQLTFRYKWTIAISLICAFTLAICWGGNITAVYPLVQLSFQGETAQDWLAKKKTEAQTKIDGYDQQIQDIQRNETLTVPEKEKRAANITKQKEYFQKILKRYEWLEPYIDKYAPTDPFLMIVYLMLFVISGTVVKCIFTFLHGYFSTKLGQLSAVELREIFFDRLLRYEVNHFTQRGVMDSMSRFTGDLGGMAEGISLVYGKLVREPLKMIACVIGAIWISWQLFLFTCLFVPLMAFLLNWMARSLKRVARNAMIQSARLYERIEESFRAIRVVKAFNREEYEQKKFHQTNLTCFDRGMKIAKYGSLVNPVIEGMATLIMIFAVLVGAWLVVGQRMELFGIPMGRQPLDLGSLILFYGFLLGAADPARRLSDFFLSLQSASAAADRVFEMIDREIPLLDPPNPKPMEKFSKSLAFRDVSFAYTMLESLATLESPRKSLFAFLKRKPLVKANEEPKYSRTIIQHVSLEIPFGETLAIVGPSGCGKSTLLNMIPRFYDPTSGTVEMDGIPLTELRQRDIRNQIGIVAQESVLFNDTVFENIRYSMPDASEEMVIDAAKKAYAHQFIMDELSDGYQTQVGPAGGQLSGGQRQRIALARAILKQPPILLLDEATSQIDVQSEQFIHQAMAKLKGTCTIIIVTHRLTAVHLADRIMTMKDGIVEACGTHEELLKKSPFYESLWKS